MTRPNPAATPQPAGRPDRESALALPVLGLQRNPDIMTFGTLIRSRFAVIFLGSFALTSLVLLPAIRFA